MCGIAGFYQTGLTSERCEDILQAMEQSLHHRGPDGGGIWHDANAGIGLAHRRLAILDLSELGRQPMASASGRYVMTYNGEVYNYGTIMAELRARGHQFRGHSDTEVLLAAFEEWGLIESVRRFVGMFAFALWDAHEQSLHLVRDRLGIKPLYYGWQGQSFLFGSELKALRAHPGFAGVVDRGSLALLLRHNFVPAPYSIYAGIAKLPPASILTLPDVYEPDSVRIETYWSLEAIAHEGVNDPFGGMDVEAVDELEALLLDAVRLRMIADVPLGAFLSGGIDSSLVTALMQAQSQQPIKTFSIGFTEQSHDEAPHARAVARYLGTEHTELYVTPTEAMDVIPKLPTIFDEPFSDSSQIPTFLVSQLTRRHVTVSLSGDGGDELFAGYRRYAKTAAIWSKLGLLSPTGRKVARQGVLSVPPSLLNRSLQWTRPAARRYGRESTPAEMAQLLAGMLASSDRRSFYRHMVSHWKNPSDIVLNSLEPGTVFESGRGAHLSTLAQEMMYLDLVNYLPDDILVKVDRASMAVALEARVPLLDHRVVEFAWRLPHQMKVRDGVTKWILRQVLYRHVPQALIDRPKMGFGVPIGHWLRDPLRDWAESLLDEGRLRDEGYFDPAPIRRKWTEHVAGSHDWAYYLWDVLMFQAWLAQNRA